MVLTNPTTLDYSENGWYFITICSKDRKNIFGKYIGNPVGTGLAPVRYKNNIKLSKLGQIIDRQLNDIPNQYDNVELDKYIIMPKHIHYILIIDKRIINKREGAKLRTAARAVPTISTIIGSFKSQCSIEYLKHIKQNNLNISGKIWQRSFYDHIIRNVVGTGLAPVRYKNNIKLSYSRAFLQSKNTAVCYVEARYY